MKVFTTNDFRGHYPVGTAAVIRAESEEDARKMLDAELERRKLVQDADGYTLQELPEAAGAVVLRDGDY